MDKNNNFQRLEFHISYYFQKFEASSFIISKSELRKYMYWRFLWMMEKYYPDLDTFRRLKLYRMIEPLGGFSTNVSMYRNTSKMPSLTAREIQEIKKNRDLMLKQYISFDEVKISLCFRDSDKIHFEQLRIKEDSVFLEELHHFVKDYLTRERSLIDMIYESELDDSKRLKKDYVRKRRIKAQRFYEAINELNLCENDSQIKLMVYRLLQLFQIISYEENQKRIESSSERENELKTFQIQYITTLLR